MIRMTTERDIKFMRTALAIAEIWSKDPSTKVGAVAVGRQPNEVAFGYNGFPPGILDTTERLACRTKKLKLVRHAEPNALTNATFPVRTLYATRHPCSRCAVDILAHRTVERVVYLGNVDFETRYEDDFAFSKTLFEEAKIELERLDPSALLLP